MNKPKKSGDKPTERVEITEARTPKKKTVHADPFARIHLHPLEELEARDNIVLKDASSGSLFDFQSNQVEPSKTNQVRPVGTKTSQNQAGQAEIDQAESRLQKTVETSPSKNFTKVPNSIAKLAIPEKYFRGLSKFTYDILYQHTRGAVTPTRIIRLTKNDLVKLTGLSIHTVKLHIKYLNESGLLVTHRLIGQHTGYAYEVFVPEEIEYDQVEPSRTKWDQNLVRHPDQVLVLLGSTNSLENKGVSIVPKTSLKTNTIDDEALADFARTMNELSRKFSNKDLSKSEKGKWKELADLLAMELEIAAVRTDSISSLPAFLTEHLRRRLIRKPNASKLQSGESLPIDGEMSEPSVYEYEAEPLSQEGRKVVLKTFNEYIKNGQRDFVLSFEDTYTKEDWLFLIENLE